MNKQLEAANELRKRAELNFETYKADHNSLKLELSEIAHMKDAKKEIKAKYKAKMESYQNTCYENMKVKIKEAELSLRDQHQFELDELTEKYALNYISIGEHEAIV